MQHDPPVSGDATKAEVWELIQALVLGRVPASQILELFYWSQEPDALEIARACFVMPPKSRAVLRAFLALARQQSISTKVDPSGQLIFFSPDITNATTILREVEKQEGVVDRTC